MPKGKHPTTIRDIIESLFAFILQLLLIILWIEITFVTTGVDLADGTVYVCLIGLLIGEILVAVAKPLHGDGM